MNILVTGGAGFIGSHTVVELINAGHKPIIIDNFNNSEKDVIGRLEKITKQKITCYEADYQDQKLLNKIFKDEQIDGVIHFAAYKAVGESVSEPLKYYRNNIAGLITLLEAMDDSGVSDLVFSSSCTVYGDPDVVPVTEDSPVKPANSPYGATKQMGETIIRDAVAASKNLRALALRYFNPIGAHPSSLIGELPIGVPNCLVPYITQTAAGIRKELTVNGDDYDTPDGTCIRDYIHVVDLAKAHVKALDYLEKQKASFYDFMNFGTGKGSSVLEVIEAFEEVSGQKLPYKIGPRRPGDAVTVFASTDKSNKVLGWKAELTLKEALRDAWNWQKTL